MRRDLPWPPNKHFFKLAIKYKTTYFNNSLLRHLPGGLCKEAWPLIKFTYPDWLICKKGLLGGHGKARRTVKLSCDECWIFPVYFLRQHFIDFENVNGQDGWILASFGFFFFFFFFGVFWIDIYYIALPSSQRYKNKTWNCSALTKILHSRLYGASLYFQYISGLACNRRENCKEPRTIMLPVDVACNHGKLKTQNYIS